MQMPETPQTLINQLCDPESSAWNGAWRRFFDIYHAPIKAMVANAFRRRSGLPAAAFAVDEVVGDVVVELDKIFKRRGYDRTRARYRSFLKAICVYKTLDYIRARSAKISEVSIDDDSADYARKLEVFYAESQKVMLEENELLAFRRAIIYDAYMSIRSFFDPQTCAAFEMIKLEGVKTEEVVRQFGISANAVNNAVWRITKKLKKIISEDEHFKDQI
ncbi:MAG: hypothetical protein IKO42_02835 [Opitutales bacterium]|nr:hypothetical protein [Opitutales bacterium]